MTFALILVSFVSLAVTSNASNIILITFPKKGLLKIDDLQLTSNRPELSPTNVPTQSYPYRHTYRSFRRTRDSRIIQGA